MHDCRFDKWIVTHKLVNAVGLGVGGRHQVHVGERLQVTERGNPGRLTTLGGKHTILTYSVNSIC